MKTALELFDLSNWDASCTSENQNHANQALENGKVLYLPHLAFNLDAEEIQFLSPSILGKKSKNISFNIHKNELKGSSLHTDKLHNLKTMLTRYFQYSTNLIKELIPHYTPTIMPGKTSFRPAEVEGRQTSYRKDDTLLHIDAFPSNPTQGQRLLRVFTNVNPIGKPRVWRLGEPLENVITRFLPKAKKPIWGVSTFLNTVGITKKYRTPYDHYMLQIHDLMKGDTEYQKNVSHEEILFHSGATWIAFTDQVSHAAMSGQHLFEQTFYLPVEGLQDPKTSPLKILEKLLNKTLV